jgi:hypothetical protein
MRLIARSLRLPPLILAAGLVVGALAAAPASAAVAAPASTVAAASPAAGSAASLCPDAVTTTFGPNVCVFKPTMSQAAIQADLNAIATQQVPVASQFDSDRYSVFFEPGTYGSAASPLVFQVGYYTQVAGLGVLPSDTVVNGAIDVFNNLCTAGTQDCNADDNFWRSLSNLDLNVDLPSTTPAYAPPAIDAFGAGCDNTAEFWAASQAAPVRRVIINGSVVLQDYCANNNFASGGFIADSQVTGDLNFFGNQQYMVRDSSIGGAAGCPNGLWNMVYSGVQGAPAQVFTGQCQQNTVLSTSPVSEEVPFLYTDSSGKFNVFVPSLRKNSSGTSWASGTEAGKSLPLSSFFVATPGTSVAAIDVALAAGKNLILTPGVYNVSAPILVSRPDTIVLGLGFATLVPQHGVIPMVVAPNTGVKVSGLIFDAGPVNSPAAAGRRVGRRPGRDPGRLLPRRRRGDHRHIGDRQPARQRVELDHRRRMGVARGPRQRRRLDREQGRHRARGHREQRDRVRPGGRALPEERGRLDRPGRHHRLLPERTALRPAQPVGME